ncbi:MAG: hypothetical protein VZS44_08545 [Bacilli bacterium]|nr:hypothetical protein [Bacilli bacterium]
MGKTILNKTGQDIEQLCEKKLASINANPIIEKTSIEDGIVRENTIYRLGTVTSAPVITAVENSYNESIIVFKTGPNVTYLNENNDSVNGLAVPQFIPTGYSLVGVPVKILEQDSSYVICYWNHLVIIKKLHDCSGGYDYSDYALVGGADAERSYVVYSGEDRDKKIKSGLGCVIDTNNKIDIISDGGIEVKIGYSTKTVDPSSTFFGDYFDGRYSQDLWDCTITGLRIGSELDDFVPSREFHDIPIEVDYGNQKLKINNDGFLIRTEGTTKKLCFVTTDSNLVNANKIDLTNSGITSLDQYPFINCSLNELILPATIDHINEYTFIKRDDGGDDLIEDIIESVTFKGTIAQWENIDDVSLGGAGAGSYWPLVIHCSDGDWVNPDRSE